MNCPQRYFTKLHTASAIAVFTVVVIGLFFSQSAHAATGINRTINFQGKLVDNNGLNVADSTYSVVFSFYDRSSSGTILWTETQSVTTVDGIFHVALGSVTAIPTNMNFNWDGMYLGMKVGADAEMTPRIRMAAVPYAFNAEKVAGLTVQDENGNASTSGTLKIPNGKTISFGGAFTTTAGNALTFTTSADTTLSLGGNGALTLVDTSTSQTLTNKIVGSTGLTFTGATTDITTGTNESFTLNPNGTGLVGIGTTSPASFFHVYGGTQGGNALAIFDQRGASTNDIFTASAAGLPKFVIGNSGNVGIGTTITSAYTLDVTGTARFTGAISVSSCTGCGGGASQWTTTGNNLYYATGGVGIGTTNPSTLLHLYDTRGGNASLIIDQQNTNADLFTASSAGTTKFVINKAGNVGIGTAMPTYTLDINVNSASGTKLSIANPSTLSGSYAQLYVSSDTVNASLYSLSSTYSSSGSDKTAGSVLATNGSGGLSIASHNPSGMVRFYTAGLTDANERMRLDSNGLLGIGTSSSTSYLTISNNGKYATGKALQVLDQYEANGDIFTASASGTTRFTINKAGNVTVASGNLTLTAGALVMGSTTRLSNAGIGTFASGSQVSAAGPAYFQIGDTSGAQGFTRIYTGLQAGVVDDSAITDGNAISYLYAAGASQASPIYKNGVGIGYGFMAPQSVLHVSGGNQGGRAALIVDQTGANTNDIFTASAAGLPKFVIGNNGNVGIGTTLTSLYNLDVTGTARFTGAITVSSCTGCGGGASQWTTTGNNIYYATGTVGIGTTSPLSPLHVYGITGGNAAAIIDQRGTNTPDIFTASASGLSRFVIRNNGNIGIGTTLPTSTLYLNGTTTGNAALSIIQNTSTGDLFTASAGATTKFVIDRSGNVGIGSSNPEAFKLEVAGNIGPAADVTYDIGSVAKRIRTLYLAGQGSGPSTPALYFNDASNNGGVFFTSASLWGLRTNDANNFAISLYTTTSVGNNAGQFIIRNNVNGTEYDRMIINPDGSASFGPNYTSFSQKGAFTVQGIYQGNALMVLDQRGGTQDIFTASASGTPKFVIGSTGNVGIGTIITSAYNLDVTGTARFTGAITVASCSGCGGGASQWTTSGTGIYFAQDGNTVGIGTTAPSTLLHLYDTRGGNASLILDQRNTTADLLTASSAGVTKFVINKDGNVGIGTSLPTSFLSINSAATGNGWGEFLASSGNSNKIEFYNGTTSTSIGRISTNISGSNFLFDSLPNSFAINSGPNSPIHLAANASAAKGITILTSGLIGLGLTAPISELHVTRQLSFGATGKALAIFDQTENQDIFAASASGLPKFVIGNNGNVGIGTALPGSALTVNGTTTGNAALTVVQNTATGDILSASAGAVTKFVVDRGGNVGIGTSIATAAKLVVSESSAPVIDMTQIVNSTGTSTSGVDGLQIDFKTAGVANNNDNSGLKVNVTSGNSGTTTTLEGITIGDLTGAQANATETALKIGTGWDTGISVGSGGITVSGGGLTLSGSGMTYSGTARPTKTLVLSAEYPGATLTASGSATITGSMTSDASPSATFGAGTNNWMNYYMWTSTMTALNDYTVAVRTTVPKDFAAWNTTALQVNFNTALTTANTNKLDVLVYRAANATATPLFYGQANTSSTANTWKTVDIPSTALTTLVAGDTFVVYLKMYAKDSNFVQIGDIVLSYLAAF